MPEHHGPPGPYSSEWEARNAVSHILTSPPEAITDGNLRLLEGALRDAGVDLGAYDQDTVLAFAALPPERIAALAGWIARAHEPSLSPREELMGPAGVAQPSTGGGGWLNGPMGGTP